MNKMDIILFTNNACDICKAITPKLKERLGRMKDSITFKTIDVKEGRGASIQYQVYTAPTLLILIQGKEYYRFIRNFSLLEVEKKLNRLVELAI